MTQDEIIERLTKLQKLHEAGVITKEELEAQKNQLLHPANTNAQNNASQNAAPQGSTSQNTTSQSTASQSTASQSTPYNPYQYPYKKSTSPWIWVLLIFGIGFLVVAGILVALFVHYSSQTSNDYDYNYDYVDSDSIAPAYYDEPSDDYYDADTVPADYYDYADSCAAY